MTAFRELLLEARDLGARALHFHVELEGIAEDDATKRWSAHALLEPGVPHLAKGRTGEEALRELVTFLRLLRTKP